MADMVALLLNLLLSRSGGEVRGYMPTPADMRQNDKIEDEQDQKEILELQQKKVCHDGDTMPRLRQMC